MISYRDQARQRNNEALLMELFFEYGEQSTYTVAYYTGWSDQYARKTILRLVKSGKLEEKPTLFGLRGCKRYRLNIPVTTIERPDQCEIMRLFYAHPPTQQEVCHA